MALENRLDLGFDWLNIPPNVELGSTTLAMRDALSNRQYSGIDPEAFRNSTITFNNPYNNIRACHRFILGMLEWGFPYCHPKYLTGTWDLNARHEYLLENSERYAEQWERAINSVWWERDGRIASLTTRLVGIWVWEDLEEITGEDLTIFKVPADEFVLPANSVWPRELLTKLYKIVDAFSYKIGQNGIDYLGTRYTAYPYTGNDGKPKETGGDISTSDFFQSYTEAEIEAIWASNTNAHGELLSNASLRSGTTIDTLPAKIGVPPGDPSYGSQNGGINYRQERYHRDQNRPDQHNYEIYGYTANGRSYAAAPLNITFGMGNEDYNTYIHESLVYWNRQAYYGAQVEYHLTYICAYTANSVGNFGTGLDFRQGGGAEFTRLNDGTWRTPTVDIPVTYNSTEFPIRTDWPPDDEYGDNTVHSNHQIVGTNWLYVNNSDFNYYKTNVPDEE